MTRDFEPPDGAESNSSWSDTDESINTDSDSGAPEPIKDHLARNNPSGSEKPCPNDKKRDLDEQTKEQEGQETSQAKRQRLNHAEMDRKIMILADLHYSFHESKRLLDLLEGFQSLVNELSKSKLKSDSRLIRVQATVNQRKTLLEHAVALSKQILELHGENGVVGKSELPNSLDKSDFLLRQYIMYSVCLFYHCCETYDGVEESIISRFSSLERHGNIVQMTESFTLVQMEGMYLGEGWKSKMEAIEADPEAKDIDLKKEAARKVRSFIEIFIRVRELKQRVKENKRPYKSVNTTQLLSSRSVYFSESVDPESVYNLYTLL